MFTSDTMVWIILPGFSIADRIDTRMNDPATGVAGGAGLEFFVLMRVDSVMMNMRITHFFQCINLVIL